MTKHYVLILMRLKLYVTKSEKHKIYIHQKKKIEIQQRGNNSILP